MNILCREAGYTFRGRTDGHMYSQRWVGVGSLPKKEHKTKGMQGQKGYIGSLLTLICYMFILGLMLAL